MLGDVSENPTGSGFGLYISNALLEVLNGTSLQVTSEMGNGTTFYFDIPISDSFLEPISESPLETVDSCYFKETTVTAIEMLPVAVPSRNLFNFEQKVNINWPNVLVVDDTEFNIFVLK